MTARTGGPPLHTHPSSETFSILEGEVDFSTLEDGVVRTVHAVPGDTVCIPGGVVHTYHNGSSTPCRCLVVVAPGGDLEGFFREIGVPVLPGQPEPTGAPDLDALLTAGQNHNFGFVMPEGGE